MGEPFLSIGGVVLAVFVTLVVFAVVMVFLLRALRPPAALPIEAPLGDLARLQTESAGRLEAMIGMLAKNQSQLQHHVNERLDAVTHRLGQSMETSKQHTVEHLQKLNERLAVIDSAQKNITTLATKMSSLETVLSNKQQRGAFGQGRMEIIVQDGLPKGCYEFQFTLSNKSRPDCVVFLPDQRPLIIDAKFPLEAATAFRDAKTEEERKQAAARLRADLARHVSDIATKYLIPGETQEQALMFVPSESVYAELHDGFDDVVQKAFRSRVVIVSPSLLMLAIQVVQQIQKDARIREAADQIRDEVGLMGKDLKLLHERVLKLQQHFGQANEDVHGRFLISAEKISRKRQNRSHRGIGIDDDQEKAGTSIATGRAATAQAQRRGIARVSMTCRSRRNTPDQFSPQSHGQACLPGWIQPDTMRA